MTTPAPGSAAKSTPVFVDNVIYDWGQFAGFSANDAAANPSGFTNQMNYACNYLIATTNSVLTNGVAFWGGSSNTWIFQTNNLVDTNHNHVRDGADTRWNMFTNQFTPFTNAFHLPELLGVDETFRAYEKVLDFA